MYINFQKHTKKNYVQKNVHRKEDVPVLCLKVKIEGGGAQNPGDTSLNKT